MRHSLCAEPRRNGHRCLPLDIGGTAGVANVVGDVGN
jgi:hypothetical protein